MDSQADLKKRGKEKEPVGEKKEIRGGVHIEDCDEKQANRFLKMGLSQDSPFTIF